MEKLTFKPRKFSDTSEVLDAIEDIKELVNSIIDEIENLKGQINEREKNSKSGFLF